MKAAVGDRLIIESPVLGTPSRDGEVIALHHADGTPPYDVRWADTGRVTVVFPGPGAHLHHFGHTRHPRPGSTTATGQAERAADS
ncbi:DUF1918 domain-containing protein [Kitasatospora sp. NPDC088346]|uniref:DUF1918 domain-containing protein n=1 Tax=Kitasatospora sp. NPDC088346 TaxID=3364073 RepID=UPI0037F78E11